MRELGKEDHILAHLDIDSESLVWIVGAFKGLTAQWLAARYDPTIIAFDPQQHAIDELRKLNLPKLTVFEAGLFNATGYAPMDEVGTDACSFFRLPGNRTSGEGAAVDVLEVVNGPVDLAVFNCEGSEYAVLTSLMQHGLIGCFRRLLIQFHTQVVSDVLHNALLYDLELTHRLAWDVLPSWGYWVNV